MNNELLNLHQLQSDATKKYLGTQHLLTAEEDLKHYNNWIVSTFLRKVQINNETKVMDFGAGIGTLSEIFFQLTGVRPDCLEIDSEQRKMIEDRGFKSYSALGEVSSKYDLIFTSNVLEHIEDDTQTLSEIKSKLVNLGVLAIFVPAFEIIWSSNDVMIGHHRRYKKESMAAKLDHSGYTVKQIRYCDSVGFLLAFIFKYIGSKSGGASSTSLRFFDRFLLPISKAMDVLVCRKFGKSIFAIAISNKASSEHSNVQ